jgi:hypothetical protein
MTTERNYDRTIDDVGNIVLLEHVNVTIASQELATLFYVSGLGFTRDPYIMVSTDNMWINVGRQQFHLPTSLTPQLLRGHVGLVVPDLGALEARLRAVKEKLAGTQFAFSAENGTVAVTSPWGNRFRCHAPDPRFGQMTLGIPYVEFPVRPGAAAGIGRFYQEVFGAPAALTQEPRGAAVRVRVGPEQSLIFRETTEPIPAYDGHHIAVYVANFSAPHAFLVRHKLITEESDAHQYRFEAIVHPETGEELFTIQHEVRSLCHPMWGREFVNRNPAQIQRAYVPGRDAFVPDLPGSRPKTS